MSSNFYRGLKLAIPISLMLWALIFAGVTHAAEVAAVPAGAVAYGTEREAAEAALLASEAMSQGTELAGGVVLSGGSYYFTAPVSSGKGDHFDIRLRFAGKLVAIYHTHPGESKGLADTFSPEDYAVAHKLKIDSYMRALSTRSTFLLGTDNVVTNLTGHSLCHGVECKEYYALVSNGYKKLYGLER